MTGKTDAGGRRRFVVAGTSMYADATWPPLEGVPTSLNVIARALQQIGFSPYATRGAPGGQALNPKIKALMERIEHVAEQSDVVVLYFTGHGYSAGKLGYRLVMTDSTLKDLAKTALAPRNFLEVITRVDDDGLPSADQPKVLCIIDACYAGGGAIEALKASLNGVGIETVWFIASSAPDSEAQDGRFAEAFRLGIAEVLRAPRAGPSQQYVELTELRNAINEFLAAKGYPEDTYLWPAPTDGNRPPPFIPNTGYRPPRDSGGEDGPPGRGPSGGPSPEDPASWITVNESGAAPTGLAAAVRTFRWAADPRRGGIALASFGRASDVTGVLSLPLANSLKVTESAFDIASESASLTEQSYGAAEVAEQLRSTFANAGLEVPILAVDSATMAESSAIDAVSDWVRGANAFPGTTKPIIVASDVPRWRSMFFDRVYPLAQRGDAKVLVSTGLEQLLAAARSPAVLPSIDLTHDISATLSDYIEHVMSTTHGASTRQTVRFLLPLTDAPTRTTSILQSTSDDTDTLGLFRLGRLVAHGRTGLGSVDVQPLQNWGVLESAIDGLVAPGTPERNLAAALAWAKGRGLPWGSIWVPVARAIAQVSGAEATETSVMTDDAVRRLLEGASELIVEGLGPGERSVFALTHSSISDLLREEVLQGLGAEDDGIGLVESAIAHTLIAGVGLDGHVVDWPNAHPYVLEHLIDHVERATDSSDLRVALARSGFPG